MISNLEIGGETAVTFAKKTSPAAMFWITHPLRTDGRCDPTCGTILLDIINEQADEADYPHSIIDFGASNSVYDDEDLLTRVENTLASYPNVILLLPSPDMDESAAILKNRLTRMLTEAGKTFTDELFELNRYFIQHPSNHQLAKRVIYTKDKTPENVCDEIMQKLV